uniref:HAT C-terminal dimerisation domain-containing protein n=1 Tax=Oryza punctata TaxID=4537 RepID=A0A0E0L2C0_ORYPU
CCSSGARGNPTSPGHEWWKEKERTLPVLGHFARDILLVLASSVSSEHALAWLEELLKNETPDTVDKCKDVTLEDPGIADAAADALADFGITTDGGDANQN